MRSIRNLLDAVQQFRLTRRYDYPALFLLIQTVVTLFKFSVLLAVFLAGFLYLDDYLNPPRSNDTSVATAPVERAPYPSAESIAQANPVAPAIGQAPAIAARPVPTLGSLARSGTTQPSAIAPDPEIALLLARLNQTGDAALRTEPDEPAKNEMHYRARIQWTNVRREPSATSPIIVSLSTDKKVRIVMQKGDWVQVQSDDIDTQNGYVLASLLEPVEPSIQ